MINRHTLKTISCTNDKCSYHVNKGGASRYELFKRSGNAFVLLCRACGTFYIYDAETGKLELSKIDKRPKKVENKQGPVPADDFMLALKKISADKT